MYLPFGTALAVIEGVAVTVAAEAAVGVVDWGLWVYAYPVDSGCWISVAKRG